MDNLHLVNTSSRRTPTVANMNRSWQMGEREKTHTASPPLEGRAAESSAMDSDPMVVSSPHTAHTHNDAPGDPTSAITKPGDAKMPEPITIPTMNVTALRSFNVRSIALRSHPSRPDGDDGGSDNATHTKPLQMQHDRRRRSPTGVGASACRVHPSVRHSNHCR